MGDVLWALDHRLTTFLGVSLRGRDGRPQSGKGSAAPPGQQPMGGERGAQDLRNGVRLGAAFPPHWLPSRREGATWLGFSWASRFAGGLEGRGPGKVALHRRGSSQWGEKEVPKICGTASAWALLSHLIGCPLGERALPGLAFLGHPASRAGWKAAVRER